MSYLVIKIPGVIPPNVHRILENKVLEAARELVFDAGVQSWSGPDFDRHWLDMKAKQEELGYLEEAYSDLEQAIADDKFEEWLNGWSAFMQKESD